MQQPDENLIPKIELISEADVRLIKDDRNKNPDKFIFYQFTTTLGERMWCLRGMEQILMDYLLYPKFVHKALDVLMEMHYKAIDKLLKLPIDGITFGDDFGSQKGLMFSKKIFCEFYKP